MPPHAYRLTPHAQTRMTEREINPWHVIRALARRGTTRMDGRAIHFDSRSRVIVITDPRRSVIVTVYRACRQQRGQ